MYAHTDTHMLAYKLHHSFSEMMCEKVGVNCKTQHRTAYKKMCGSRCQPKAQKKSKKTKIQKQYKKGTANANIQMQMADSEHMNAPKQEHSFISVVRVHIYTYMCVCLFSN
uniref:Uncharacterized protein n=1 Tax=Ceratitis capitata TaxID=7213 RepID=W8C0J0_CERCA